MSTEDESERLAKIWADGHYPHSRMYETEGTNGFNGFVAGFRAGEKSENVMRLINEVKGLIHSCGSDYCTYPDCGCFPEIKRILESLNASPEEKK